MTHSSIRLPDQISDHGPIDSLLRHSRQKLHRESLWLLFAVTALFGALYHLAANAVNSLGAVIITLSAVIVALGWLLWRSIKRHRTLTPENLAAHLNREFAELEESAQLLLRPAKSLAILGQLQRQKVVDVCQQLQQQQRFKRCIGAFRYRLGLGLLLLAAGLWWSAERLPWSLLTATDRADSIAVGEKNPQTLIPELLAMTVTVHPPAYTGLPVAQFSGGDIEVPEGARVQWQMRFSADDPDYYLLLGEQLPIALLRQPDGQYSVTRVIDKTTLYRIGYGSIDNSNSNKDLPGVYALSVRKDQPPKVRITEPDQSLLVLAKSAEPKFTAQALISDDFGVGEVKILASVAKGSGEAVKFRDAEFQFDGKRPGPQGELYYKAWDLPTLGMEPGDEVYFTVVASDNKSPEAQQGRSGTVIVRWLDDEAAGISADGVVLNFVAEYFRSQRQIIIDTEQLIADKTELSVEQFSAMSVELGQAQSDLKQRYGQYLGDEFGEGPGDQLDVPEAEADHDKGHDEAHGHDHADPGAHGRDINSGAAQGNAAAVVNQFAHAHEEVHVGQVNKQNPKAMMKKAVAIMWQAELHLMLSDPEQALPHEKQAYKYLKLAKQAERIYVKRLGFVPPPVTESNRLSGELKDIDSYRRNSQAQQDPDDRQPLFRRAFSLLNRADGGDTLLSLSPLERQTLEQLKASFTELAQTRPGLIRQAAMVEKMLLANTLQAVGCDDCIRRLTDRLWRLIHTPLSQPLAGQQNFINSDAVITDYARQRHGQIHGQIHKELQ